MLKFTKQHQATLEAQFMKTSSNTEAKLKKSVAYKKKRVFSVLSFVFLTNSLPNTSLNFFKRKGTVFSLPTSKSSIFVFKSFKPIRKLTNLLISSLSPSVFKAIKSFLAA